MTVNEKFIAFKTILIKEILRFVRIWVQTILPPMITTALYFVIFGNLINRKMMGVDYIDFMIPGLVLLAVITNAYGNVVSSFFSAKFQRNVEEMLVSPIPNYLIVLGFTAGGVARGIAVGIAVLAVSMFFGDMQIHSIFVILSIAVITSVLFSLAGLINGIYAKKFDDITVFPTFVLTPLTYLGGVFYSINEGILSPFWQQLSLYNPILHMVNVFRYGFIGKSDVDILQAYLICIGFIIALYLLALQLVKRGHGLRS